MSANKPLQIRRQHHVWRHYLEAWAAEDGRLYCLNSEKIFPLNPRNAAVENYFYKLQRLEKIDIDFLHGLIEKCPPASHKSLRELVMQFTVWHKLEATVLEGFSRNKDLLLKEIRTQINNFEENYHASIEERAVPIISELRKGAIECLSDCWRRPETEPVLRVVPK